MSWMLFTRLGEAQILVPLDLAAAAWLWLGARQGRLALRWLFCLGLVAGLTAATKLAFIGWEMGVAAWDFTGISGHSMFAAGSFPMLAWLAVMNRGRGAQRLGIALAFGLAALIAYSRLPVHAHSPSEAIAGFLVGSIASLISLRGLPGSHPAAVPLWLPAGLAVVLLVSPVSAPPSHSHELVTALSLRLSGRDQPYTREDMLRKYRLQRQQQQSPLRASVPRAAAFSVSL